MALELSTYSGIELVTAFDAVSSMNQGSVPDAEITAETTEISSRIVTNVRIAAVPPFFITELISIATPVVAKTYARHMARDGRNDVTSPPVTANATATATM